MTDSTPNIWAGRLREFVPGLLARAGVESDHLAIVLHGSTTRGVDDAWSDLDVWLLAKTAPAPRVIDFELAGKVGHCNLEDHARMLGRMRSCETHLIYEWRSAIILSDPAGLAARLQSAARFDMPADVRLALFRREYLLMRQAHRTADNPLQRGQSLAALQNFIPAITHALRAAMSIDGEPYPYDKWLATAARTGPIGRRVLDLAESAAVLLQTDPRALHGPEKENPVSQHLRRMRQVLVESAAAAGITAPWLRFWWHEIERAMEDIQWPI